MLKNILLYILITSTITFVIPKNIQATDKIVIDHLNWNPSNFNETILDNIRTLKIIHLHRSVGCNIANGLKQLKDTNPDRYYLYFTHAPINPNYMNEPGYGYELISELEGYDDPVPPDAFKDIYHYCRKIRSIDNYGKQWGNVVDIAEFNVGWSGVKRFTDPDSLFVYYIDKMESIMVEYPACKFIYYTCNLKTEQDCYNDNRKEDQITRHLFNEKLRAYIDHNGGYLFDVADLESHDENGILHTFEYEGSHYPVLWHVPENEANDGWGDSTSHLNDRGKIRMALAKWNLWCSIIQQPLNVKPSTKNISSSYHLFQNFPNPFNSDTQISFFLPVPDMVTIKIYNLTGCEIMTLINECKPAGKHTVTFNSNNLTNGMYLFKFSTKQSKFYSTKKMLIIK